MGNFNHTKVSDLIAQIDDAAPRAGATRAFDQRVVHLMGRILAPVVSTHLKELRTANAALERRIAELEGKLDIARRLDAIEARLDAQPTATVRRIA